MKLLWNVGWEFVKGCNVALPQMELDRTDVQTPSTRAPQPIHGQIFKCINIIQYIKLFALSSITQCKMEWTIGRRLRYKWFWSERGGGWSKMDGSRSDGGALTQWSSVLDRFDLWGHSGLTQPSIIAEMKKNAEPLLSIYNSLVWSSPFALLYLNTFKKIT